METREQCVQYIMAISNLFHEANSQGPNLNVQKCSKKRSWRRGQPCFWDWRKSSEISRKKNEKQHNEGYFPADDRS
jgi:hypothetical protein